MEMIEEEINEVISSSTLSREFDCGYFKTGDIVLFGKYKNKRGKVVSVGHDERGLPTVVIEPIPKGRKKNIEMGLFRIWHNAIKNKEEEDLT